MGFLTFAFSAELLLSVLCRYIADVTLNLTVMRGILIQVLRHDNSALVDLSVSRGLISFQAISDIGRMRISRRE